MGKRLREEALSPVLHIHQENGSSSIESKRRKLHQADEVDKDDVDNRTTIEELNNGKTLNGIYDQDGDEAKVARKEEKRRLKAAKQANGVRNNHDSTSSDIQVVPEADKAARKAEKRRLKALKKASSNAQASDAAGDVVTSPQINGGSNKQNGHIYSGRYTESEELTALSQSQVDDYLSQHSITITDPESKTTLRPITAFSYLPDATVQGSSLFTSFAAPTPIQAATWPFILAGRDVIGIAETGSGKTLAFGVPLIKHITSTKTKAKSKSPARAVIISPTRELAVQIHEQIETIARLAGFKAVCIYGGVPKEPQKEGLKTASVIIATPGRLNDLLQERSADISNVDYLVLDEADRMLDKGFEEEIKKIISETLPTKQRQTLMFTATWPQSVRALANTFMQNPVKITIGDHASGELRANTRIEQRVEVLDTHPRTKETRLLQLLKELQPPRTNKKSGDAQANRVLIFALYKKEAARIEQFLHQRGHNVAGIHGDLSQDRRSAALNGFRAGTTPLLVATDVAARGLDIPAVKAVINLTFPLTVEDYVHRIGRTGRAGSNGLAITFFTEHDKGLAGGLVNVLRAAKQNVPEELLKFGGTVKKKQHDAYGAFYKEPVGDKKATKMRFDD
ncbi:MAG: RNA-dependent ATPase [Gomphillus americanus]|uniref:RNA helicase n=1 Tax=Gomphillus americanus TaxID=1940652 RepID=A0A8H3F0L5_9LECA|nr:MAG: RNA-dependent ATPase [Gomphillus americanus]